MKLRQLIFATALFLLGGSMANADLQPRLDGQAVYDTDLGITWLANANLPLSQKFDLGSYIQPDGSMDWATANAYIARMNDCASGSGWLGIRTSAPENPPLPGKKAPIDTPKLLGQNSLDTQFSFFYICFTQKRVLINSIYESFVRYIILQVEFIERGWNKFHLAIPLIRIEITCIPNKCMFIMKCFPSTEWGYIMKRAIKKVPM